MKELPKISDTEWIVMKVIWAKSPITASEVIESLAGSTSWKPKTIKTLLSRLLQKGAIGYERDNSRSYHYYPLVAEHECIKAESQSFLKRVYGGALNLMFANFLEEQRLSKEDIEELKRILDERKD